MYPLPCADPVLFLLSLSAYLACGGETSRHPDIKLGPRPTAAGGRYSFQQARNGPGGGHEKEMDVRGLERSGEDAWRIARIDACTTTNSRATGRAQPLIGLACWMRGNTDRLHPGPLVLCACCDYWSACLASRMLVSASLQRCGHGRASSSVILHLTYNPFIHLHEPGSEHQTRSLLQPPAPVSHSEALHLQAPYPNRSGDLARQSSCLLLSSTRQSHVMAAGRRPDSSAWHL
ncbi:hypothetical protein LI328DRAFT_164123 [Trichoderma asperelloides]|nr:hypothetical protein LI328DRAFT_164123 [Trichoderma asperelloides]